MTKEGWFRYTICEQMSNIAAEVHHFIEARDRFANHTASEDYSGFYLDKALSYIDIIKEDPKNIHRIAELNDCKTELKLLAAGVLADGYITRYWDQYTDSCAYRAQHEDDA